MYSKIHNQSQFSIIFLILYFRIFLRIVICYETLKPRNVNFTDIRSIIIDLRGNLKEKHGKGLKNWTCWRFETSKKILLRLSSA
jgi:hypothetical protein